MTPFDQAISLFRSGSTHDDVVARLIATGFADEDARNAARAAQARTDAELAPLAAEAVKPGFHGWLLFAIIMHSLYAAVTLFGLAAFAALLPWLAGRYDPGMLGFAIIHFSCAAVAGTTLVIGMVLLFKRRASARSWLIAWATMWLVIQFATLFLTEGSVISTVIALCWFTYFFNSKQLRETLTR